jgi:hypothetical protein
MTEVIAEGMQLGPRTISSNLVSDIKQDKNDEIPIIDANDQISSGIEEDEIKIKEEDLPF